MNAPAPLEYPGSQHRLGAISITFITIGITGFLDEEEVVRKLGNLSTLYPNMHREYCSWKSDFQRAIVKRGETRKRGRLARIILARCRGTHACQPGSFRQILTTLDDQGRTFLSINLNGLEGDFLDDSGDRANLHLVTNM